MIWDQFGSGTSFRSGTSLGLGPVFGSETSMGLGPVLDLGPVFGSETSWGVVSVLGLRPTLDCPQYVPGKPSSGVYLMVQFM